MKPYLQPRPKTNPAKIRTFKIRLATTPGQIAATVAAIGSGIRAGSSYFPLRQNAAGQASKAPPKNYLEQLHEIYKDFVKRWRYVKDPVETEFVHVTGPAIWEHIAGAASPSNQYGVGDCDDATVYMGAAAYSIGLPVRIVTISPPGSPALFTHVYPQVHIPRLGWVCADPVGYPEQNFGWKPPAQRTAIWNVKGELQEQFGSFPKNWDKPFRKRRKHAGLSGLEQRVKSRGIEMRYENFPDYGLENMGLAGTDNQAPLPWDVHQVREFGKYIDRGFINGDQLPYMMEYDDDDVLLGSDGNEYVRTKMLEIAPEELEFMGRYGKPRGGMVVLADDGDVYQFVDEGAMLGGFFKKLFKKAKKGIKKGFRKARKFARKAIKRLPGGKYVVKLGGKLRKVAMKLVRPLAKFAGKWAKRLAPIAALIPGYGPAIAGALYATGKIADIAKKMGVKLGPGGIPKRFKNPKQADKFKRQLERAASRQKPVKVRRKKKRRRRALPSPEQIRRMQRGRMPRPPGMMGQEIDPNAFIDGLGYVVDPNAYIDGLDAYKRNLHMFKPAWYRRRKALEAIRRGDRVARRRGVAKLMQGGTKKSRAFLAGCGCDLPE